MTDFAHQEQGERQRVDPDMGLGEFLTTMQMFACVSQREVSEEFDVSQQSVSRWMQGISTPSYGSANANRISEIFDLSDDELRNLIANNEPWEKPDTSRKTFVRRRLGHRLSQDTAEAAEGAPEKTYAAQMLAAFVVRAEQGPPLNEVEADLIRFLVQSEMEQPEN